MYDILPGSLQRLAESQCALIDVEAQAGKIGGHVREPDPAFAYATARKSS